MSHRTLLLAYLGLLLLQVIWHFLLPAPWGSQSWILALIACLPLLLPLRGMVNARPRSLLWGSFLATLYFVIAVMEVWSNPQQRWPAVVQLILALSYCGLFIIYSRQPKPLH